jgi:hypothetical protein
MSSKERRSKGWKLAPMGSVHWQHCNYSHREEATSATSEEKGEDHAAGPCPAAVLHNFRSYYETRKHDKQVHRIYC